MGGGASKPVNLQQSVTVKHREPFFMELKVECADFPNAQGGGA